MALADDYERQFGWRPWSAILAALPPVEGQRVLDLGCGVGDLAREFVARGARVVGVDANDELLARARALDLRDAEFVGADLRELPDLGRRTDGPFDGLWSSFTAAYFPRLCDVLPTWSQRVRHDGWIALTEIDDLFGHEPLASRTRTLLAGYAEEAFAVGRYDFRMGGRLRDHLEHAGLRVEQTLECEDRELSFDGPADTAVLDAWRARIDRMTLLRAFCGHEFAAVRDDFLHALTAPDHHSRARVVCCIATVPRPGLPDGPRTLR